MIRFVYSINTDTFYPDSGFERPDDIERWANVQEIEKLKRNIDYLTFISNE
jgi:hypothetical protein